jgi:hypothetical protein
VIVEYGHGISATSVRYPALPLLSFSQHSVAPDQPKFAAELMHEACTELMFGLFNQDRDNTVVPFAEVSIGDLLQKSDRAVYDEMQARGLAAEKQGLCALQFGAGLDLRGQLLAIKFDSYSALKNPQIAMDRPIDPALLQTLQAMGDTSTAPKAKANAQAQLRVCQVNLSQLEIDLSSGKCCWADKLNGTSTTHEATDAKTWWSLW